jgi:hypothetical protein
VAPCAAMVERGKGTAPPAAGPHRPAQAAAPPARGAPLAAQLVSESAREQAREKVWGQPIHDGLKSFAAMFYRDQGVCAALFDVNETSWLACSASA